MQINIRKALAFHIEGMVENGEMIPEPRMSGQEARAYYKGTLDGYCLRDLTHFDGTVADLPATVEMIEIEVRHHERSR